MKKIYCFIIQLILISVAYSQHGWRNANFRVAELGGAIELSWAALNETNLERHEIEKSNNGTDFSKIGVITAQNLNGNSPYIFRDATPLEGLNYYRVRSLNGAGGIFYSDVLRIDRGYRRTDINVYPNPVTNGIVRLQMNNIPSGRYAIMIYNNGGTQVYSQSMVLSEGTSTHRINLPSTLGKGTYVLQVTNGNSRVNRNLLVN